MCIMLILSCWSLGAPVFTEYQLFARFISLADILSQQLQEGFWLLLSEIASSIPPLILLIFPCNFVIAFVCI